MSISFDVIVDAFMFVSMEQQYVHSAYLRKETGQTFFKSGSAARKMILI